MLLLPLVSKVPAPQPSAVLLVPGAGQEGLVAVAVLPMPRG